jgi:hypothetical protein
MKRTIAHRIRLTRYLNIAREITYLFVETGLRSNGEELEKVNGAPNQKDSTPRRTFR